MEAEIRALFIKYGVAEVKECIEKECRRMYESLQSIYEVKRKYERKVKVEEPPNPSVEEPKNPPVEEPPKAPVVKKIRKVKPVIEVQKDEQCENTENLFQIIKKSNKILESVPSVASSTAPSVESEQSVQSNEESENDHIDVREVHRMIVAEKNKELLEKGIVPESLLTKENLEKWLKSGKSYMRIAKETGVYEGDVSRTARNFGLSSAPSKYKFYKKTKTLQK